MAKASEAWRELLAEQILGQMIFAAGSGSGGQWVAMEAITEIRKYFKQFIDGVLQSGSQSTATREWKEEAAHVLHYMDTIGRVATQRSIGACKYWIDGTTMRDAIKCVVADVNVTVEAPAGRWCGAK